MWHNGTCSRETCTSWRIWEASANKRVISRNHNLQPCSHEKGNPCFKESEIMRVFITICRAQQWMRSNYYSHKPAKNTYMLLKLLSHLYHKTLHISILKEYYTLPILYTIQSLEQQRIYKFPFRNPHLHPLQEALISFSCIDNTVCLASTFCMTASRKYRNPALRTSHFLRAPFKFCKQKSSEN